MDGFYLLLQLSDSAFPTGGFSHSLGLESFLDYVRNNEIGGKDGYRTARVDLSKLRQAFISVLENAGSFSVPLVKASHSACLELMKNSDTNESASIDISSLSNIDQVCEANSSNHIAKRASIRQKIPQNGTITGNIMLKCGVPHGKCAPDGLRCEKGRSLIETACLVFGGLSWQIKSALEKLPHGHYPVVIGALLAGLGTTSSVAVSVFMFSVIRGLVATAVRLDALGAMEGQIWQSQFQELIPDIIERNSHRGENDVCLKFPVLDVLQNNQDTLFCKLFYS